MAQEIIDPTYVQDIFVEGIALIERIVGAGLRMTLYANHSLGDGEVEKLVVARLVMSVMAANVCHRQVDAFLQGVPFLSDTAPDNPPN